MSCRKGNTPPALNAAQRTSRAPRAPRAPCVVQLLCLRALLCNSRPCLICVVNAH